MNVHNKYKNLDVIFCVNPLLTYLYFNEVKVSYNTYHTSDAVENFLYNNDSGAIHFTGSLVADVTL